MKKRPVLTLWRSSKHTSIDILSGRVDPEVLRADYSGLLGAINHPKLLNDFSPEDLKKYGFPLPRVGQVLVVVPTFKPVPAKKGGRK
jgi:hypothetical protein